MPHLKALILSAALLNPIAAQNPSAEQILEGAKLSATLTQMEDGLQGMLNHNGNKIPIILFLKGKDIQFQYTENTKQRVFHMRLSDNSYQLFEIIDGKTINFPPNKLTESIAGTDLTYEDLALRFFYWPNPKLEGTEDVTGQTCYRLRLDKPKNTAGRYEGVYVWIHTKYGAFMRIRGHDLNGGLIKEFQVEDVMKIKGDVWVLEKMQVSTHDPKSGRRVSITDLVLKKPTSSGLRGLR